MTDRASPGPRRWLAPLAAVAFVVAVLAVRATWEQRAAWTRAVQAERAGATWDAVEAYRNVLRWHTPWGPDVDAACDALLDLARRHEKTTPELAVHALDGLRSGLIAARSVYQPRADLVLAAGQRLPALLVRVAERGGDKRDPGVLLAQFSADYARPVGVGAGISLAVALGFLVWVGGLTLAFHRGVDGDGHWTRGGLPWLAASLGGFCTWALALWLA
ncbi:MAG: hypothetical protein EXR79_10490 [Myxococcales bacterium]|nr:hypothetical protein [Myxococcales bacterium]